jgi:hypothetical protein
MARRRRRDAAMEEEGEEEINGIELDGAEVDASASTSGGPLRIVL